nr:hypothetical protein [Delftia acidovorans]
MATNPLLEAAQRRDAQAAARAQPGRARQTNPLVEAAGLSGGMVRGPGTGTSDSIPARLSHGEYVLPADTVAAVGQGALDQLRAATHTPVQRYADGGLVDDPGAVTRVGNSYSGMDVRGNVTINGQAPGGTFNENPGMRSTPMAAGMASAGIGAASSPSAAAAPAPGTAASNPGLTPSSPTDWIGRNAQRSLEVTASSIMPSRARDDAQAQLGLTAKPPGAPPQGDDLMAPDAPGLPGRRPMPSFGSPAVPSRPAFGAQQPRGYADGGLVEDERRRAALINQIPTDGQRQAPLADGSQSNPLNNDFGRNLAALPSAGGIPGAALRGTGLVARAFGASQPAMSGIGQVAQAAAPYAPVVGGGALLAGAANSSTPAVARAPAAPRMSSNPLVQTTFDSTTPASAAAPRVVAATSSDGAISPQSQQAARGLASYASEPPPAMGQNRIPLIEAAGIRHSGNDWQARNDLRNAAVSASSIMNTRDWGGNGAENSPAMQEYRAMLATDQALRQADPGLQAEGMRQGNALVRAAMEQQGQNQRAGMQAGLSQQKLDMDRETQGYTNRTNRLVEAARNQVAGEQDPAKRRSLVQYMRDIEGGTPQADPYLVVPGGQQVDPTSGRAYNTPSTVFNRQSGQFVQQPAQAGSRQAPAAGTVEGGWKFRGGDPSDQRNWERA